MCAFGALYVQAEGASFGIRTDGCIAGVGKRTGLAVAEAREVVFIAAEVLLFAAQSAERSCQWPTSLQCVWVVARAYFNLYEQNCWFITCHTISSEDITAVLIERKSERNCKVTRSASGGA